jgi:hypothetical protein
MQLLRGNKQERVKVHQEEEVGYRIVKIVRMERVVLQNRRVINRGGEMGNNVYAKGGWVSCCDFALFDFGCYSLLVTRCRQLRGRTVAVGRGV